MCIFYAYRSSLQLYWQLYNYNVTIVIIDEELFTEYLIYGAYQCSFNIKEKCPLTNSMRVCCCHRHPFIRGSIIV